MKFIQHETIQHHFLPYFLPLHKQAEQYKLYRARIVSLAELTLAALAFVVVLCSFQYTALAQVQIEHRLGQTHTTY